MSASSMVATAAGSRVSGEVARRGPPAVRAAGSAGAAGQRQAWLVAAGRGRVGRAHLREGIVAAADGRDFL